MDFVNMFDPVTLFNPYQCALAFEKQNRRVGSSPSPAITGGSFGSGNVTSRFVPNQTKSECKKVGKRHLSADLEEWEDDGVADDNYEEPLVFGDDQYKEEIMRGDVGVNLMVRRSFLTPKAVRDDWLKHNIY
ncbi:hypothetical protein Tco_1219670 [Tanacetum coccineum]